MKDRIDPALCVVWLGAVVLCAATWAGVWLLVRQMPGMDAGRRWEL